MRQCAGMIVEVSTRTFVVPFECPCCGADPDTELAIPVTRPAGREVSRDTARALHFPYCKRCVEHVEVWESAGLRSAAVMVAGIVAAVVVSLATRLVIGAIAFAAAALLAWSLGAARRGAARAGLGPSCASPDKALAYLGWSGSTSAFSFESPTYAARFAEQNEKHLLHVHEQLRKLLEGHRIARLAVPTPAAPHLVVPPPASVSDWIARLEGSRSTVERRNTLRRALDAARDDAERAQLLEAACRIELAPILGKIDGIGSAGARKHQLQRAIDEVRADNIQEELQTAEVRQLESRLRGT
jgi:hypothetical protein